MLERDRFYFSTIIVASWAIAAISPIPTAMDLFTARDRSRSTSSIRPRDATLANELDERAWPRRHVSMRGVVEHQPREGLRPVVQHGDQLPLRDESLDAPLVHRRPYDAYAAYAQSKTANVLFAVALDVRGREHGVRAFAVHPGAILTDLIRWLSPEETKATLELATRHPPRPPPATRRSRSACARGLSIPRSPSVSGRSARSGPVRRSRDRQNQASRPPWRPNCESLLLFVPATPMSACGVKVKPTCRESDATNCASTLAAMR